jgi:tubulin--tyrosine ligase
VGQSIKPTYYCPPPPASSSDPANVPVESNDLGTTSTHPLPQHAADEEWILVDSTPASCIQIGLYHYFKERGPFDLVISGPNYGRNTTAVFALSSGTLGGALEAAVCGMRSIALSYAFFDRNHDPLVIAAASRASVRVIEYLTKNWKEDVQVYSVNTPLLEGVETTKVLWTRMLQNQWESGSCFTEIQVPDSEDADPSEAEQEIRKAESLSSGKNSNLTGKEENADGKNGHLRYTHKHFKWSPRFKDVYDSVEKAAPGNDGWAVKEGYIRYDFAISNMNEPN